MKKAFIVGLLSYFAVIMQGYSENVQSPNIEQNLIERPNRIYFGPEFLGFQVNTDVKSVHVDGHKFFWGLRVGYEYLKPRAFYGAAELLATNTCHDFSYSQDGIDYTKQGSAGFGNLATRFGYTFLSSDCCLVTPYLGLGVYSLSKRCHSGFEESLAYLSGGIRSRFEYNSIFHIGLNGEVFRTLGLRQKVTIQSEKFTNHKNEWGGSIGIPMTIRLSKGWNMQIVPYYLRLLFSQSQNIYGTSIIFGYRF